MILQECFEFDQPIVVLSLNTALDRTVRVDSLIPGRTHVARQEFACAGGKALNVARTASALGLPVEVVGFAGGTVGRTVRNLASREGITGRWVSTSGESRTCTVLVGDGGEATVINGRGPAVTMDEYQTLVQRVEERVRRGSVLVMTGSAPPGIAHDVYAKVLAQARQRGVAATVVDASGPLLVAAARAGPTILKVNREEFSLLCEDTDAASSVRCLMEGGTRLVVITLGADGAMAFATEGAWRVAPLNVDVVNPTGAGDAFLAGLLAGLTRRWPLTRALALATAAAALNTSRLAPGIPSRESVQERLEDVSVYPLARDDDWGWGSCPAKA